jgi:DNA invertase Pin-like site-specific DNA recombinase
MRVALYARVSTESQQARGTIGSQLAVLRERVGVEGEEVVAEFCDDGHSGARLDRPGLDALRDAAEAGLIERVWCLSADRLARVYAYQVIVLDELARHGVGVRFTDAPPLDDDPQAKLLTQVQGVIAEYERAKIAERYRRGKLFRSRAGEVLAWRTPYGYRRQPRDAHGPARLEVFEPEAAIVRRIFDDYVHGGHSLREIIRRLAADQIPPPTSRDRLWRPSTLSNLLRNQAYIGRVYVNRTEAVPDPRPGKRSRQVPRPARTGSPSRCPPSSMTRPSRRPGGSAATTANGAPAAPNPANGCCVAWSNAGSAASARTATTGAAATAPGTATTTAATTTRSKPAGTTGAAPNATSVPTPSTRSCSTRSAPPCCAPTCSPPANRPSPCAPPPPTTTCSPPS